MKTPTETKVQINIQLPIDVREDFRRVAHSERSSMSALIYRFIIQTINEARANKPEIFPNFKTDEHTPLTQQNNAWEEHLKMHGLSAEAQQRLAQAVVEILTNETQNLGTTTSGHVVARIEPGDPLITEKSDAVEAFNRIMGKVINVRPGRKR